MTTVKYYVLIASLVAMLACGKDENPVPVNEPEEITIISVQDFTISIDENLEEGAVLGTLIGTSEQGAVVFTLLSQSVSGALALNSTSGMLSINDATVFDYETNPEITAVFSASLNGVTEEGDIIITINDLEEAVVIDLADYRYVEQTGTSNPFDGIDIGTDSYPSTADVDGDGDLDLIVGSLEGDFSYFKNENGAFTPITGDNNPFNGFDTGSDSRHQLADLDGDGDLDLISGSGGGALFYYENENGVYTHQMENHILDDFTYLTLDSKPAFIDYDNDGDLDMLVGYYNQVALWDNLANSFAASASGIFNASLDQTHQFPTFADLDNDGVMELIAGRYSGDFRLLTKGEDGNYSVPSGIDLFNGLDVGDYSSPAFIDLDGDGLLEMISGNNQGTIKYFVLEEK